MFSVRKKTNNCQHKDNLLPSKTHWRCGSHLVLQEAARKPNPQCSRKPIDGTREHGDWSPCWLGVVTTRICLIFLQWRIQVWYCPLDDAYVTLSAEITFKWFPSAVLLAASLALVETGLHLGVTAIPPLPSQTERHPSLPVHPGYWTVGLTGGIVGWLLLLLVISFQVNYLGNQ